MKLATRHKEQLNTLFWQKFPLACAKVSSLLGETVIDGRYLLKFPGLAALTPLILFIFGAFSGATHFFIEQPLYLSVIPMLGVFVLISFISGGLGMISIIGYALGHLLLFDHLILIRDIYHEQMMNKYGLQVYAGIFFNLIIFLFLPTLPIVSRLISIKAANQILGPQAVKKPKRYFSIYLATKILMTILFMLVWIQMVTLGAFSYYLWWGRGYTEWDFEQFIGASLWGLHPLMWASFAGIVIRIILETSIAAGNGFHATAINLPSPFAIYCRIPLSVKSVVAGCIMYLVLQSYIADMPSLWGYLLAAVVFLFVVRDGLEIWLHKWFAVIECIPLAYRLIALFVLMGFCVHHLTEYLADNIYIRTPEPHIIVLAITICLPLAFLLVSKNEPHRNKPPPRAPCWLKPFAAALKQIKAPRSLRKSGTHGLPFIFGIVVLGINHSAFAHHCFHGCDSCDYFTEFFNWLAGGTAGIFGALLGRGEADNHQDDNADTGSELSGNEEDVLIDTKITTASYIEDENNQGSVHDNVENKEWQPDHLTQEEWDAELERLTELEKGGTKRVYPESWLIAGGIAGKLGQKTAQQLVVKIKNLFANKNFKQIEKAADHKFLAKGWTKKPLKNGEGVRYFDGKGNSVQLNKGYKGSNDKIHRKPYIKYTEGNQIKRVPLKGDTIK